ncbi:zinc-binding alcohol dehydrogenase family protein, partial [Thermodesulfobacteriota bacterium]
GGYAEYVSRRETEVMPAPKSVPWEKLGSCVWSYSTSWDIVSRRGDLQPGQSVLITGASGGMGTAAIQLCRLVGASKIIATSGSPTKVEKLKQIGVDHVVNYHDADAADQVKSLTNGMGVDLVIDFIGDKMFLLGMNCLRLAGKIINVAGMDATTPLPLNVLAGLLIGKRVDILSVRGSKRIDNKMVLQFLGEGEIDPVIDRVMPLSEAAKAHEILEKQEHIGKIVLVPQSEA